MGKVKIGNVIGPTGPEGKQGKSGTMKVGTVRTLQPGEAATVSNSGTAENAVLDFAIPRGDDGITDLVAEYKDASEHNCTPTVAAPVVIKEVYGKTVQDGTPTPDNPVEIRGVGDGGSLVVESRGKNLIDFEEWSSKSPIIRGGAVFDNRDRSVTLTATADDCYTAHGSSNYIIPVKSDTKYAISWECLGGGGNVSIFLNAISSNGKGISNTQKKMVFTTKSDTKFITFRVGVQAANTTCKYWNLQLEEGETVTPYQPYHHTTATIPLSSPLYDGDKICCVQPGESYVDADGNRAVAHRVMWGVRRENGVAVFDGSADEGWLHENGWKNNAYYSSSKLSNLERVEGYTTIADVYSNFGLANSASKVSDSVGITNGVAIGGIKNLYVFAGDICQKGDVLAWREYLSTHNLHVVYKLATPYFEPFPNQSPFHALRSADDLTYIYTDDALKPEITVDVAKQAAGGYLLSGYMDREDGIMVDKTSGVECVLGMEDGLLTVYEIEED